jgi:hypothetical protein
VAPDAPCLRRSLSLPLAASFAISDGFFSNLLRVGRFFCGFHLGIVSRLPSGLRCATWRSPGRYRSHAVETCGIRRVCGGILCYPSAVTVLLHRGLTAFCPRGCPPAAARVAAYLMAGYAVSEAEGLMVRAGRIRLMTSRALLASFILFACGLRSGLARALADPVCVDAYG